VGRSERRGGRVSDLPQEFKQQVAQALAAGMCGRAPACITCAGEADRAAPYVAVPLAVGQRARDALVLLERTASNSSERSAVVTQEFLRDVLQASDSAALLAALRGEPS